MNTLFLSNGNQLVVPNTVNLIDDKMAYFVSYLYTYPFQHKEYIKNVTSSPKKFLKGESTEIRNLRDSGDSIGIRDSVSFGSRVQDTGNTSYSYVVNSGIDDTLYSYVVTSDDYLNCWDGFIPVYSQSMRKIITTNSYTSTRDSLIDLGLIEVDYSYSNFVGNKKTMRYALTENYRFSEPKIYELSNIRFVNKLNNINTNRRTTLIPLLQKLEDKIFEVDFDDESASNYVKNTTYKNVESRGAREIGISIMKNRPSTNYFIREGSKSTRVFSPITSLPRDLRPYLSYQGKQLWDVDISCALPTLFNKYLIGLDYKDVKEYKNLTSDNGENYGLYERLGEIWRIPIINDDTRNNIKKLTMVLFFGRGNTIRKYRYLFNNAFPNVYNVMKKIKRK